MSAQLSTATTKPTEERGGPKIEPTRVECPFCRRSGVTDYAVNMCMCGRWFEVTDAQEVYGDE